MERVPGLLQKVKTESEAHGDKITKLVRAKKAVIAYSNEISSQMKNEIN